MQKKLGSLSVVVSLGLAASFMIVACGDGIVDKLEGKLFEDMLTAEQRLDSDDKVAEIMSDQPLPPSSANPTPGSSANPGGSSAYNPTPGGSSTGGNTTTSSSSSIPKSSAVAATGKCKDSNPKSGFTCGWDGYSAAKILTPGTLLKPAAATPPSGCSSIAWSFAPDTSGMMLNYSCNVLPADGEPALGSSNYVLFAELTCDDGKHINACDPKTGWSSKKAPELAGRCVWDKDPPDVTSARGAKPSGVTIVDTDAICTSPTVVYKYDNQSKTWPATGKLDEWKTWPKDKTETYKVEAVLNCPAYSQTVAMSCPDLKVSGGVEHVIECTCPGNGQCQIDEKNCKADAVAGKAVNLKVSECVELTVYGYDNQYYSPKVGMRCQSNGSSYTVSINGTSTPGTSDLLLLGTMKQGDNEFGTFCVTSLSGGSGSISCSLNGE